MKKGIYIVLVLALLLLTSPALAKEANGVQNGDLVKESCSTDVYLVNNWKLTHLYDDFTFRFLGYDYSDIETYDCFALDSFKANGITILQEPKEGDLLRANGDSDIYKYTNSKIKLIPDECTFYAMGYTSLTNDPRLVSDLTTLNLLTKGSAYPIHSSCVDNPNPKYSNGDIVSVSGDPSIFYIQNNQKRWYQNEYSWWKHGTHSNNIIDLTWFELNNIPNGQSIFYAIPWSSQTCVEDSETDNIYYVENSKLRKFPSVAIMQQWCGSTIQSNHPLRWHGAFGTDMESKSEEPKLYGEGNLISSSATVDVFLYSNSKKNLISNYYTLWKKGYVDDPIIEISSTELNSISLGNVIKEDIPYTFGSCIKNQDLKIYYFDGVSLRYVPNLDIQSDWCTSVINSDHNLDWHESYGADMELKEDESNCETGGYYAATVGINPNQCTSDETILYGKTIILDPGHGPGYPGKSGTSGEWEVVHAMAPKLQDVLESYGATVYITPSFYDVNDRALFANDRGGDILVSMHLNGNADSSANGYESFYRAQSTGNIVSKQSEILCEHFTDFIAPILNSNVRGVKSDDLAGTLGVLRGSNMPACLIEYEFITAQREVGFNGVTYDNHRVIINSQEYKDKAIEATVKGILSYFDREVEDIIIPPSGPQTHLVDPGTVYSDNSQTHIYVGDIEGFLKPITDAASFLWAGFELNDWTQATSLSNTQISNSILTEPLDISDCSSTQGLVDVPECISDVNPNLPLPSTLKFSTSSVDDTWSKVKVEEGTIISSPLKNLIRYEPDNDGVTDRDNFVIKNHWRGNYDHEEEGSGSHAGVDIMTYKGEEVYAIADGTIVADQKATIRDVLKINERLGPMKYGKTYDVDSNGNSYRYGENGGYGGMVIIRHDQIKLDGEPIYSVYLHLSNFSSELVIGSRVKSGQYIGNLADGWNAELNAGAGYSTAPHLHFQLEVEPFSPCSDQFGKGCSWPYEPGLNTHIADTGTLNKLTINPMKFLEQYNYVTPKEARILKARQDKLSLNDLNSVKVVYASNFAVIESPKTSLYRMAIASSPSMIDAVIKEPSSNGLTIEVTKEPKYVRVQDFDAGISNVIEISNNSLAIFEAEPVPWSQISSPTCLKEPSKVNFVETVEYQNGRLYVEGSHTWENVFYELNYTINGVSKTLREDFPAFRIAASEFNSPKLLNGTIVELEITGETLCEKGEPTRKTFVIKYPKKEGTLSSGQTIPNILYPNSYMPPTRNTFVVWDDADFKANAERVQFDNGKGHYGNYWVTYYQNDEQLSFDLEPVNGVQPFVSVNYHDLHETPLGSKRVTINVAKDEPIVKLIDIDFGTEVKSNQNIEIRALIENTGNVDFYGKVYFDWSTDTGSFLADKADRYAYAGIPAHSRQWVRVIARDNGRVNPQVKKINAKLFDLKSNLIQEFSEPFTYVDKWEPEINKFRVDLNSMWYLNLKPGYTSSIMYHFDDETKISDVKLYQSIDEGDWSQITLSDKTPQKTLYVPYTPINDNYEVKFKLEVSDGINTATRETPYYKVRKSTPFEVDFNPELNDVYFNQTFDVEWNSVMNSGKYYEAISLYSGSTKLKSFDGVESPLSVTLDLNRDYENLYFKYFGKDEYQQVMEAESGRFDYFTEEPLYGCTNPEAENFNETATANDGSCFVEVLGCTDPVALNTNDLANTNDGSCEYPKTCEEFDVSSGYTFDWYVQEAHPIKSAQLQGFLADGSWKTYPLTFDGTKYSTTLPSLKSGLVEFVVRYVREDGHEAWSPSTFGQSGVVRVNGIPLTCEYSIATNGPRYKFTLQGESLVPTGETQTTCTQLCSNDHERVKVNGNSFIIPTTVGSPVCYGDSNCDRSQLSIRGNFNGWVDTDVTNSCGAANIVSKYATDQSGFKLVTLAGGWVQPNHCHPDVKYVGNDANGYADFYVKPDLSLTTSKICSSATDLTVSALPRCEVPKGCMDGKAENFDPNAQVEDDSCKYLTFTVESNETQVTYGQAVKFTPKINFGDAVNLKLVIKSSSTIEGDQYQQIYDGKFGTDEHVPTYTSDVYRFRVEATATSSTGYVATYNGAWITYFVSKGCTDVDALNYDPLAIENDGTCKYPVSCPSIYQPVCGVDNKTYSSECHANMENISVAYESECIEEVLGCKLMNSLNYNPNATKDDGSCIPKIIGCMELDAKNYQNDANVEGDCIYYVDGCTDQLATNYDLKADRDDDSCTYIEDCMDPLAKNYNPNATKEGACYYWKDGCVDPIALNFDSTADRDDNSCTYKEGCTDPIALNYDETAVINGTCNYKEGCMDLTANNYDSSAVVPAICIYPIKGCTNSSALNYDVLAEVDDDSCRFKEGCTDSTAFNFDEFANLDDGSCIAKIFGCMDLTAKNYDSGANVGDNSCEYYVDGCTDPLATNYNSNADREDNSCKFKLGCTNSDAFNFDASAVIDDGSCISVIEGCMDSSMFNYNPDANTPLDCEEIVIGCMDDSMFNYDENANVAGECVEKVFGCMDETALNFNELANTADGSCVEIIGGCINEGAFNYDVDANFDDGSCVEVVIGCMEQNAFNYNSDANTAGECVEKVFGCTDASAFNFDEFANFDDGSCIAKVTGCLDVTAKNFDKYANVAGECIYFVEGCTNSTAKNYNPLAEIDDNSCIYYVDGCTYETALNYDELADRDDGSCIMPIYGCMDVNSTNYNINANVDQGCIYSEDLSVESFKLITKSVIVNEPSLFQVLLSNNGEFTQTSLLQLEFAGDTQESQITLNSGQEQYVIVKLIPKEEGSKIAKVVIDARNDIKEFNEENNVKTYGVQI